MVPHAWHFGLRVRVWRRMNGVWGAKAVIREGEGERPTTVLTKVADRECGRRHHV